MVFDINGKDIYEIDKSKARNILKSLEDLAEEAETAFVNYIEGEKQPHNSVKFSGGEVDMDGYSFAGNTNKVVQPLFFMGYNNSFEDIAKLDKYGVNLIQIEIGPHHYIKSPSEAVWNYEGDRSCFDLGADEKYSGEHCLEINNSGEESFLLYQDISLAVGSYLIKCYTKGSDVI